MSDAINTYNDLKERLQKLALLRSCGTLLSWDEQTNLPPQGGEFRAAQMALIAGLSHDGATDPRIGELIDQLESMSSEFEPDSDEAANLREAKRSYERSTKLPKRLVEEMSRVTTLSQQAWVEARKKSEFSLFQPWLEQVVQLKREEADALGSASGNRYDALLDDYEPGARSEEIQQVFEPLRDELVQLVAAIQDSDAADQSSILERRYPVELQKKLSREAAEKIGFDFSAGRLDVAAHPFCMTINPGDCRLTTRYDESHFPGAFFGSLHEAGHGLYEQGLRADSFGLGIGEACSLGIHESQSRMWENLVGRSREFWEFFFPQVKSIFSEALSEVSLEEFYSAINTVKPSFIRVEADEVTYNLHIMLRFEMEQALLSEDLQVKDVPSVWNEKFQSYFSMTPPNDTMGCLQDIHWSAGLIGYFPTYSLGNMYASQFFLKADQDLGGLSQQFRQGEFGPLKDWLRTHIHQQGRRYDAPRLVEEVTGAPLSSEHLVTHLKTKFGEIYHIA